MLKQKWGMVEEERSCCTVSNFYADPEQWSGSSILMSAGDNYDPVPLLFARTLHFEYADALFKTTELRYNLNGEPGPPENIDGKFWKLHESVHRSFADLKPGSPLLIVTNKSGGNIVLGIVFVLSQEDLVSFHAQNPNVLWKVQLQPKKWPWVYVLGEKRIAFSPHLKMPFTKGDPPRNGVAWRLSDTQKKYIYIMPCNVVTSLNFLDRLQPSLNVYIEWHSKVNNANLFPNTDEFCIKITVMAGYSNSLQQTDPRCKTVTEKFLIFQFWNIRVEENMIFHIVN